jgi:hypothetical protein
VGEADWIERSRKVTLLSHETSRTAAATTHSPRPPSSGWSLSTQRAAASGCSAADWAPEEYAPARPSGGGVALSVVVAAGK